MKLLGRAQWKGEEIQEGYLVSGSLIPLIIPVTTPLWILGNRASIP